MNKGIITSPLKVTSEGDKVMIEQAMTPEIYRYFALYWDKTLIVDSNIFGLSPSEDLQILQQAGVFEFKTAVTSVYGNGTAFANAHVKAVASIAGERAQDGKGLWGFHPLGQKLFVPESVRADLITAEFELLNCLPVPRKDVSFNDLLEFKTKRHDELNALRETLEEMYLDITKSQDIPRATNQQVRRLQSAIQELNVVAKESWGSTLFASRTVSIDLNFNSIKDFGLISALVGNYFSSPLVGVVSGLAYATVSSLKLEISKSQQFSNICGKQLDLSYLSSIRCENIA